jgi:predicted permease
VAGQVAGTVALLIVASLLMRSFSRLVGQQRGFDASHVTMAQVDLFTPQYGDTVKDVNAVKAAFADRAMAALRGLPGVQQVALTSAVPLTGETWVDLLERPDHPLPENEKKPVNVRWISEDYVPVMQVPLVAGRNLTSADRNNPYVVLISEKTAAEGFAGENPLGKTIKGILPGGDEKPMTIVGVVADTRINSLKEDASLMMYAPYWTFTPWRLVFMVKSTGPSEALMPAIRKAIWQIDPQVPIPSIKSMDEQVSSSVATERFQTVVLASFGASALLLALLGIYGVLAYSVSLRQIEFGIRMALGSGRRQLMELVMRQAAGPVLLGCGAGLVLALVAARWIRSLLYETPVLDPVAIAGSLLLLMGSAVVAAVAPARRASAIDPAQAIRNE